MCLSVYWALSFFLPLFFVLFFSTMMYFRRGFCYILSGSGTLRITLITVAILYVFL